MSTAPARLARRQSQTPRGGRTRDGGWLGGRGRGMQGLWPSTCVQAVALGARECRMACSCDFAYVRAPQRPCPSAAWNIGAPKAWTDIDLTYKVPSSGKSTPSQKVSVFAACLSPRAASWALAAVSPVLGLLVACVDPARAARTATGPHLRPQSASGRGRIVQGEWVGMKKVPLKTLRQWHVSFGASGVQLQLNAADSGQVGVFAEQVACPPSRLYLCRRPSSSPPPPCLDMSRSTQPWEQPEV